jgi:hypothetical protein
MIRTYASPLAFKEALEARLRERAQRDGRSINRVRQLVVMERFLARVFAGFDSAVLKGGMVMELRLERARATKDVDLRLNGRANDILDRLQAAGRSDLLDFLSFEVRSDAAHPVIEADGLLYEGQRFRAEARLAGRVYGSTFGVDVAIAALSRFASITRAQKVEALFPFATAAVRDAADGQEFVDRVKKETGVTLRVLSGGDEARFAAEGVLAGTPGVDGVAGDLGGSSLELARLTAGKYDGGSTYPLGPFALDTGAGFTEDKIMARVKDVLSGSPELKKSGDVFFAVGGAWRAIGTLHMELTRAPLHMLQNYEMDAPELLKLLGDIISGKKHAELTQEVARKRAATIPFAAAVLKNVIEIGKCGFPA